MWYRRKALHGSKLGQKIGFPTVNFHVGSFKNAYSTGVYACEVIVKEKKYKGALHFGPKLTAKKLSLEIHILKYSGHLYGQYVRFCVGKKIRSTKRFTDVEALKKQIQKDLLGLV